MPQDDDRLDDQASRPDPFEREDKDNLFNPALDEPQLPGDYGRTPAAPPEDVRESLHKADPRTDSNIQPEEVYDEGVTGATDFDALEEEDNGDLPERIA
jgi:hypothetical protein